MTTTDVTTATEVGSYFISNYPPFSLWTEQNVPEILKAFDRPVQQTSDTIAGLYIHIPFCRKRCKFCYFRVYTNQNAAAIEEYVQALIREIELISHKRGVQGREFEFVYFGGGTPSYLSSKQLRSLRERMSEHVTWEKAKEVTFECEPGTLSLDKVQTLKDIGITRISLGVENFNDSILEQNGRAHLSPEVMKAYDWIQSVGFPQVNIDLIAGMVGETDANWRQCIDKAIAMQPDNITIYQMELPFNTVYSKEMSEKGVESLVADWPTKRRWVSEAMDQMLANGYHISSGNELVRNPESDQFVYRDNVWRGCDLIATGVSSFGHFQGVHYQNLDRIEDYISTVTTGDLPVNRALRPSDHQMLIRELVLLMKEGHISGNAFHEKYGVDILTQFADAFSNQQSAGYLTVDGDNVKLTRKGLLQVDSLLPEYFEEEHRAVRYT
ncbi:MAG: coproporphyrinogen-III oxidase family protein [Fuerstiella sp.]|jgi:oxygen-independent coproporphyrinogen-3 oxidase|nr:coproporphyrinogen-III oxidase family protein [Fuerstiella sp.]